MSVQERVARGTRWLDEVSPGWRDALELRTLNLKHGGHCVLGQVFSEEAAAHGGKNACGYTYVLGALLTEAEWLDCPGWPSAHGFDSAQPSVICGWTEDELDDDPQMPVEEEIPALEAEWRRVIHVPRDEFASPVLRR
jgi:hypothetical protein